MHRVYNLNGQIIFTENSNSPVGKPLGSIIEVDVGKWSFFASTSDAFNLEAMSTITNKLVTLQARPKNESENNQFLLELDDL